MSHMAKQKKTSILLLPCVHAAFGELRNRWGVQRSISAALDLFGELSKAEQVDVIDKMYAKNEDWEKKHGGEAAHREAAQAVWEILPPEAQKAALEAVRDGRKQDLKTLVTAAKRKAAKEIVDGAVSRRKARGRARGRRSG